MKTLIADGHKLNADIADLNKQVVNTEAAIEGINRIIRTSGFQGFSLKAKEGVQNTYEVIRPDGSVAEKLSEGERNFIAFLYFYHLVKGSTEEEYRCKGIAGKMLDYVIEDLRSKNISPVYLITEHTNFYERYGWEFLCMVQGEGQDEKIRMYVHH